MINLRLNSAATKEGPARNLTEIFAAIFMTLQVSLCHRLGAGAPWLRPVLNALGYAQKYCLACGLAGGAKDLENFVHCQNYGCRGKTQKNHICNAIKIYRSGTTIDHTYCEEN